MSDNTETVATFEHDGNTYEIDHLGITNSHQYGDYAVYFKNEQVAEFSSAASWFKPGHQPDLPEAHDLIALARELIPTRTVTAHAESHR